MQERNFEADLRKARSWTLGDRKMPNRKQTGERLAYFLMDLKE
jgi:hypothetical protein